MFQPGCIAARTPREFHHRLLGVGSHRVSRLLSAAVALAALAASGCDVPTTPETPAPVAPAPPTPAPATPPPAPAPAGTFQALPPQITRGGCSNLSWITTGATTLTIDQGVGPVPPGGSVVVCPTVTTTYTLTASGAGGTLDPPLTVTIVVADPSQPTTPSGGGGGGNGGTTATDPAAHRPGGSLVAIPETIRRGESAILAWAISDAQRASISPAVGAVDFLGARAVSPPATTTYTLSASGPGGILSPEPRVTVTVLAPPTGSIRANPREIAQGECATLSWSTGDATTQFVHPEVGDVPASGSRTVCPAETTTYRLNAAGRGGVLGPPPAVTILVRVPLKPTGTLVAVPGTIPRGACSTLTWMTLRATGQSLDQGIGSVSASGSRSVCPVADTTYTLSASGPGGSLGPQPAATVIVTEPRPAGSLGATRTAIFRGECTTLSWTTTGATSRTIAPGIGSVAAAGSDAAVCPAITTTYTLIASGPGGSLSPSPTVTIAVGDPPPSGSLEADPPSVDTGSCSNLVWSIADATSVSFDQGIGSVSASGSRPACPAATTTYTLSASGPGGSLSPALLATVAVAATPAPTGSLGAAPPTILRGECSRLQWSTTGAANRSLDQGIGSVGASGSRAVCPVATTTYTLSASGPGGSLSPEPTATIAVIDPPPTGSLDGNPNAITGGECSNLSWTTTGATSRSLDQGIGAVGASGSRSVCPAITTTYALSASGPGGILSPEPTVTISVATPAPTGGMSADPLEIDSGECSTLRWNTTDATSVSLNPGVGSVDATGSRQVCPATTTTYTLTATGPGGSLSPPPAVTVTVRRPSAAPTGTLTATAEDIRRRECTTLVWSTADATSQSINPGIGVVESSGTREVCPSQTTTYTLSASGPGGSLAPEPAVTISVSAWGVPSGTFTASPPVIGRGECSTLTWTTAEAQHGQLGPDIGRVAPSGSMEVCPTKSVRYRLDAWNPDRAMSSLFAPISFAPAEPVLCQAVSVSGTPMSAELPGTCDAQIVDFRVETDKADSTILDFYRPYPILGWSVQEVNDRYRHDVKVLWDPYDDRSFLFAGPAEMQPMIIHACPAGGTESVLACSGARCDVYADEASVPAVTLPSLRIRFSAPWGYPEVRELAEGETLDIPLSYEVGHDDLSADYGVSVEFRFFHHSGPSLTRTVHRTPERQTLQIRPGGPRTGTLRFQLSTDRDDVSQGDEDLLVSYGVGRVAGTSDSGSPGCTAQPNWIRIRLTDR